MSYEAHIHAFYLQYRENVHTILAGTVLPTVKVHVICKNWHMYRLCWEDCEPKNLHVTTSPNVAAVITGILKKAKGE